MRYLIELGLFLVILAGLFIVITYIYRVIFSGKESGHGIMGGRNQGGEGKDAGEGKGNDS